MRLTADFPGESVRFEGSRTVQIPGLPEGAQIQKAIITLTPAAAPGRPLFEEVLTFAGSVGDFGMTKILHPGDADMPSVVEVDFHARRTLAVVRGSSLEDSELVVDLGGGVFMGINEYGAVAASEDVDLYQLPATGVLPGLLAGKFRLRALTNPLPTLDVTQVTVRTAANNVSLALAGMPPFWALPGEITTAVSTPDFADFLQLYLQEADVSNGRYQLPLVIHSDSLARLSVLVDIEYRRQQSALPAGLDEVSLPYGYDSTAQADSALVQVTMPVGAEVTEASVQVLGAFDESRIVYGPTGPLDPVAAVSVIGGRGQAQPVVLAADTAVTAIDLLLSSVSRAAVLDLNLMADVDGKPFADPLLPVPVVLELDRDLAANPTWISARLPQEFQFAAGKRYWLIVQAREGEAAWHSQTAVADSDALQHSTTGGLSWRLTRVDGVAGPLAGFFRLRRTPDQYQMPLSVLVGEGETAVPVSLDRFQPLGRIDFTIDFPEFVAAINEAARRTEAASCARGEQLQNGDFAHWSTIGESFGPLQEATGIPGLSSIVIAPSGEWALAGLETGGSGVISLPLHQPLAGAFPPLVSRQHAAISPNSQRLYLMSEVNESTDLYVIDAAAFEPMGSRISLPGSANCLTLSPDGRILYVGSFAFSPPHGEIWALDTAVLAQLLAGSAAFSASEALVGDPIPLEEGFRPVSLAVSPDGRRLFAAAAREQTAAGSVYVFDTASQQSLVDPIFAGNNPMDLALTPDGRRALVVNSSDDSLTLIDAARLRHERTLHLPRPADGVLLPVAVAIAPNGRRAFVANRETASVSVIDLVTLEVRQPVPVGEPDFGDINVAVTPSGDRLYVALQNPYPDTTSGLRFLPLGRQQPDNWTLTTGFVQPIPFADPFHLTAVLGPVAPQEREARPLRPSALSQATAVVGGCTYDLSFWGITDSLEAVAEVIWRGGACAVQRTDRIPIQLPEIENSIRPAPQTFPGGLQPGGFSDSATGAALAVNVNAAVARRLPELLFHRARLQAPEGATQAEIRFLAPPEHNAVVDSVSLQATSDTITNGDLLLVQDGELAGWQLAPASVTGVTLNAVDDGVELANQEAVPISLKQSFAVTGGQPFVLQLRGAIVSQLAGGTPQVRLDWLDAEGNAAGTSSLSVVAGQQEHQLETAVPAAAATATLNLVLPPGTTLLVQQISFVPVELVTVPVHFLAQAPGKLTVTGFDVAYDVGEVATTPIPPEGLCPPTPPGRSGTGDSGCCAWCTSPCGPCGDDESASPNEGAAAPARALQTSAPRRPAAVASRPATVRPAVAHPPLAVAAPAPPEIRGVETAVAPLLTATAADWAVRAPELAALSVPLAAINGIAEIRARALAELGVDSIPRLAAAAPEDIANALRGVSLPTAERFVAEAQTMRANVAGLPAPLVSCIMPTFDRRPFVPLAIDLFLRQDYPNRELIILDDGRDPVRSLVPDDERIRYVRLDTRQTIGAKRNLGGEEARGPILASWDDDVWYAPWRLSYQVAALTEYGADVVGLDNLLHYDPFARRGWHSVRPSGKWPWMPGSTLCYTKAFWRTNAFPDMQPGEDIRFLRQQSTAKIVPLQAISWLVDIIHEANTSPKPADSPLWFAYPVNNLLALLGSDEAFYAHLAEAQLG